MSDAGALTREAVERLEEMAALIHAWNPRVNLTGYKSVSEIEKLLIGESVAALSVLKLERCSVLDFGSGAGIPGLVWSLCEPSLRVVSLEIRHKKVAFQKEVLRRLGIAAEVVQGHFPEAVAARRFDCIVSRAIRLDARVWENSSRLLSPEGRIVRFATPGVVEEGWRALPVSEHTTLLLQP
ncbi:MAG TPA: RsmG family class I SAM-dependent methyltransferase [Acidobacteriota bacterium]|nr:RsmG family class I SAM-dependent methyltransferase [Acidobacteriota bacterium]